MARELTLADGQLGTSAASVLSGADAPSGVVSGIFHNTSDVEQTVLLTFKRSGGTARRLVRAVLLENEQLIVSNLPMQPDDTLLGRTTTASTVDYLIYSATRGGQFGVVCLGADGLTKQELSTAATTALTVVGDMDIVESPSVEVLLSEQNSLLRRLVLSAEVLCGGAIPDPA